MTLMPYEREILEECAGLRPSRGWGAAVGSALEYLKRNGYLDPRGNPTEKGLDAVAPLYRIEGHTVTHVEVRNNQYDTLWHGARVWP